ncbi:MAG TPA: SpoIID/LytB domain-containing protein, partial [Symbiobacteriaceae bacterium]|nr:SpoIID/LytB domain-containing protein [Symbiobacteriaceae bacterium]
IRLVPVGPVPAPVAPGAVVPAPANPLSYKGKTYRGELEVLVVPDSQKSPKLNVVNVVNLEEYLYSVVSREMNYDWPQEALKAQAVAARTYASSHMASGSKWQGEGFDMVATTQDQDYGGLAAERGPHSQAVAATQGQVLTYGGKYATTFYHASSGGHTENNEVIYGYNPIPYLRGVPDFDNVPGNTRFSWQYAYTLEEFARLLAESGYDVGTVTSATPAGLLGVSGRASQWLVTGTKGSVTINHSPLRFLLDIPSSARSVTVQPPGLGSATRTYAATQSVTVVGPDGKLTSRAVRGMVAVGAGGAPVPVNGSLTATGGQLEHVGGVTVSGGGYGHAVGMSQFGAYGMALQKKTYVEILTHFYKGTTVETR